jgi:hypothetical protein
MKILREECVDQRLRLLFVGHDCRSAAYSGLAGKNGALLAAAREAGFDALVTTDQEISFQQNLSERRIAVVIPSGDTNRLGDLKPLVTLALSRLEGIQPGEVARIGEPTGCPTRQPWASFHLPPLVTVKSGRQTVRELRERLGVVTGPREYYHRRE